jgi:hypothetical protein
VVQSVVYGPLHEEMAVRWRDLGALESNGIGLRLTTFLLLWQYKGLLVVESGCDGRCHKELGNDLLKLMSAARFPGRNPDMGTMGGRRRVWKKDGIQSYLQRPEGC